MATEVSGFFGDMTEVVDTMGGGLMMPSQFAEEYLELHDGEADGPYRIGDNGFMRQILDGDARHQHVVIARQVGKTTMMGVKSLAFTSLRPGTTIVVISSASDNVGVYEKQKLRPFMMSPKWRAEFYDSKESDNVGFKQLRNGSQIMLRGAYTGGARIRGITGGAIFIDEIQHVERDVVEEAESVMTRSKLKMMMTGGTQSHSESSVNHYWEISDQREWMVKCSHCTRWSDALDVGNIGKHGLICRKCGGALNTATDPGQWVITGNRHALVVGHHFPLIALPNHPWDDVLYKLQKFSPRMFSIDVMAKSYDFATKPITRDELIGLCDQNYKRWLTPEECRGRRCVIGIDWGKGIDSTTQICVLVELSRGKLKVALMRKLTGSDAGPKQTRAIVAQLAEDYAAQIVVADEGGQFEHNPMLLNHFGSDRFQAVMLIHGQKAAIQFAENEMHWVASKTKALERFFLQLKRGTFTLPAWDLFEPFGKEILCEYVEYSENKEDQARYDHPTDKPDDSLHALNFGYIGYLFLTGEFKTAHKLPKGKRVPPMFTSG